MTQDKVIETEEWPVDQVRFIAFMDIMGFKDLVIRKSHNEVKKLFIEMIDFNKSIVDIFGKKLYESFSNLSQRPRIRTISFSDSILFMSQENTFEDFINLSYTVATVQNAALCRSLPTKGAISMGMMTADFENSIFFGQPLIDAYLLQEELNYYGVIVDNIVESFMIESMNSDLNKKQKIEGSYKRIKTPLKNGNVFHYNVKISNLMRDNIDNLYKGISGSPRKYIDNTVEICQIMDQQ